MNRAATGDRASGCDASNALGRRPAALTRP